jgi:hypothetical protein
LPGFVLTCPGAGCRARVFPEFRHHLRRSALQHLAADGRTAPELQAKSRQHLAILGCYVRLGEQASARVTAEADPAARRRTCLANP